DTGCAAVDQARDVRRGRCDQLIGDVDRRDGGGDGASLLTASRASDDDLIERHGRWLQREVRRDLAVRAHRHGLSRRRIADPPGDDGVAARGQTTNAVASVSARTCTETAALDL